MYSYTRAPNLPGAPMRPSTRRQTRTKRRRGPLQRESTRALAFPERNSIRAGSAQLFRPMLVTPSTSSRSAESGGIRDLGWVKSQEITRDLITKEAFICQNKGTIRDGVS